MIEIFKNIAAVVGCVLSCIALCTTIIKPLRQWFINSILNKSQYQNLNDNVNEMNKKIDTILQANEKIEKRIQGIEQKIQSIEKNALECESDRLKSELSDYYNRCCRGLQLFPEEFLRVEEVYDRYHNQLGLNHVGTNMFDAIEKYYKQQDFIKMHGHSNNN